MLNNYVSQLRKATGYPAGGAEVQAKRDAYWKRVADRLGDWGALSVDERNDVAIMHWPYVRKKAARLHLLNEEAGLPFSATHEDLFHAGVCGLLESVDGYDSSRGRFMTIAKYRVSSSMNDALWSSSRAGLTSKQNLSVGAMLWELSHGLSGELRNNTNSNYRLHHFNIECSVEDIADSPIAVEGDQYAALVKKDLDFLVHSLKGDLGGAGVSGLGNDPQRTLCVIDHYFGFVSPESFTLEEVAQVYGVTRERARQIRDRVKVVVNRLSKSARSDGSQKKARQLKELWID